MIFEHRDFDGHERVCFVEDKSASLRAIIAIHSTARGSAAGGCRIWNYASSTEALADVLRLSRGMSLKAAAADLPLGGGKAVIVRPSTPHDRRRLMEAFGSAVDALGGTYWTAEDVGTSVEDMEAVARRTRYVAGRATGACPSGDPSPFTALGVAVCMRSAASHVWGTGSLAGLKVAVQGLGSVGIELCGMLHKEGASLVVADLDAAKTKAAVERFAATAIRVDEIHAAACDVLAPCALGGILTAGNIPHIRARLVCGAANNQLANIEGAEQLQMRGITYAPDFIVNAGGICSVASEILNIAEPKWVTDKVTALGRTLHHVLARSVETRTPRHSRRSHRAPRALEVKPRVQQDRRDMRIQDHKRKSQTQERQATYGIIGPSARSLPKPRAQPHFLVGSSASGLGCVTTPCRGPRPASAKAW